MSFLEELAGYLRAVERPTEARAFAHSVHPALARKLLLEALERREKKPDSRLGKAPAEKLLREWQGNDRVVHFAQRLERLLRAGMGQAATPKEIVKWVGVAIARRVGLPKKQLSSAIRTAELDRLSDEAWAEASRVARSAEDQDLERYAGAVRATQRQGGVVELTSIGRVFLELTGRDAALWLLHAEVEQSIGPKDEWRISREIVRDLAKQPRQTLDLSIGERWVAGRGEALKRLQAIGLLSRWTDDEEREEVWQVNPTGVEVLKQIDQQTESPLSSLVKTLLADLTLSALSATPAGRRLAKTTAAEATARQARLVAHEIRNALLPVKTSLGFLYREVQVDATSDVVTRRRETIDRGVEEIFRFIDQLVKVAALADVPPEPFHVIPVLEDAIAAVDPAPGIKIVRDLPASLPLVSGHRARLVMALVNLLRNAVQHGGERLTQVRVSAEEADNGRAVALAIEDDGKGVAETMRHAIFDEGISLTPGGTGLGLALVREVAEKEMRGLVICEGSSLGGARFVIRLPVTGSGA